VDIAIPQFVYDIGFPVSLSGALSVGADSYSWSLQVPDGSAAVLTSTSTVTTSFTPDVAGSYWVSLAVSNLWGTRSITDVVPVFAVAATVQDAQAAVGQSALFDGSRSAGVSLNYSWTLTAAPTGSQAVLTNANKAVAGLVPDMMGNYQATLTVSDGLNSSTATETLQVAAQSLVPLPRSYNPGAYSHALAKLVLVEPIATAIHLFDPFTGYDRTISLGPGTMASGAVGLSSDELFASVVYTDGTVSFAYLAVVDLSAARVVATWPLPKVYSVVLGDPITLDGRSTRLAYLFNESGQVSTTVQQLDIGNGEISSSVTLPSSTAYAAPALAPGQNAIALVNGGSLSRLDLDPQTGAIIGWQSITSTNPIFGSEVWAPPGTTEVITDTGHVYRLTDLSSVGALPQSQLGSADFSAVNKQWVTGYQNSISLFDDPNLTGANQYLVPEYFGSGAAEAMQIDAVYFDSTNEHTIAVLHDARYFNGYYVSIR
jgi:hypothetical protein